MELHLFANQNLLNIRHFQWFDLRTDTVVCFPRDSLFSNHIFICPLKIFIFWLKLEDF